MRGSNGTSINGPFRNTRAIGRTSITRPPYSSGLGPDRRERRSLTMGGTRTKKNQASAGSPTVAQSIGNSAAPPPERIQSLPAAVATAPAPHTVTPSHTKCVSDRGRRRVSEGCKDGALGAATGNLTPPPSGSAPLELTLPSFCLGGTTWAPAAGDSGP
jgi:hypothetical protein